MLSFFKYALKRVLHRNDNLREVPNSGLSFVKGLLKVYAIQGSCMFFTRRFFEAGGTLKYPCFLFGEELYLAETARRLGLDIVYNPKMQMEHRDHVSTGFPRSRIMAKYIGEATRFIYREYFMNRTD